MLLIISINKQVKVWVGMYHSWCPKFKSSLATKLSPGQPGIPKIPSQNKMIATLMTKDLKINQYFVKFSWIFYYTNKMVFSVAKQIF